MRKNGGTLCIFFLWRNVSQVHSALLSSSYHYWGTYCAREVIHACTTYARVRTFIIHCMCTAGKWDHLQCTMYENFINTLCLSYDRFSQLLHIRCEQSTTGASDAAGKQHLPAVKSCRIAQEVLKKFANFAHINTTMAHCCIFRHYFVTYWSFIALLVTDLPFSVTASSDFLSI